MAFFSVSNVISSASWDWRDNAVSATCALATRGHYTAHAGPLNVPLMMVVRIESAGFIHMLTNGFHDLSMTFTITSL